MGPEGGVSGGFSSGHPAAASAPRKSNWGKKRGWNKLLRSQIYVITADRCIRGGSPYPRGFNFKESLIIMKTKTQKASATQKVGRGGMAAGWTHRRTSLVAISAMAMGWIATSMNASAAYNVSIDGGAAWTGWTSEGQSNQLGVYASGTTTDVYEVYTTIFSFDSGAHVKTGSPTGGGPTGGSSGFGTGSFSTGAFTTGNRILGIGVRRISGATLSSSVQTIRFDLAGASSYAPASTVGGTDGRASFSGGSAYKDFTVQFSSANSWAGANINVQANNPGPYNNGAFGGTNNTQTISYASVSSDWPYRVFALTDSYQAFFDLDAMTTLYGVSNPFGANANFVGIGTFGSTVNFSMNGLGGNHVAFGAPADPTPVPEPASAVTVLALFSGAVLQRRKRVVKH